MSILKKNIGLTLFSTAFISVSVYYLNVSTSQESGVTESLLFLLISALIILLIANYGKTAI
jgi:hypothetical protein